MIQAPLPRQAAPQLDLNQLAKQVMQPWTDAYDNWRSGVAISSSSESAIVRPC